METEQLQALVAGLPATKDLIIEEHMRLGLSIGIYYARKHRRQHDDLVQAAYLGIVQAVAWAPTRLHDNNITPYIVANIHRFCREAIEADHTVIVERRARRHYVETRGNPCSVAVTDDRCVEHDTGQNICFDELLASFCPRHRAVVRLRLDGATQVEIATALHVSQPMVHKYIKEIKEKLSMFPDYGPNLKERL